MNGKICFSQIFNNRANYNCVVVRQMLSPFNNYIMSVSLLKNFDKTVISCHYTSPVLIGTPNEILTNDDSNFIPLTIVAIRRGSQQQRSFSLNHLLDARFVCICTIQFITSLNYSNFIICNFKVHDYWAK